MVNIITYDLDTDESIISRIAAELDTIPKYLYFPDGFNRDNYENVEDILRMIRESDDIIYTYDENNLQEKIETNKLKFKNDILRPFLAYNKDLVNYSEDLVRNILFEMEDNIKDKLGIEGLGISNSWSDRKYTKDFLDKSIEENKAKDRENKEFFNRLETLEYADLRQYSEFDLEKTMFNLVLDSGGISLLEIFNLFHLNDNIPFASLDEFYKVHKDTKIYSDEDDEGDIWIISFDDEIILKILQKKVPIDVEKSDYKSIYIEKVNNKLFVKFGDASKKKSSYFDMNKNHKSVDQLIETFQSILPSFDILHREETYINGAYYIPRYMIDKYIIADMIMNNPLFSSLMYIDESRQPVSNLFIYFSHANIKVEITNQIRDENDTYLIGKSKDMFHVGESYVRIKIREASNLESVKDFQKLFSKLLYIYEEEKVNIIDFYRQYIPDFGVYKPKEVKKPRTAKLKDIVPDLFIEGYSRKCQKNLPSISETIPEDREYMIYPKEGNRKIYICDHENRPFPGLMVNKLDNKDEYPYLPCCYGTNQKDIYGSKYRNYYYGDELKKSTQTSITSSDKFVDKDRLGTLPININNLLEFVQDGEYYRKGVDSSKNSFIHCVLKALEQEENIERLRDSLVDNAVTCRQELYDLSVNDIKSKIRDSEEYFDPNLFVRLIEDKFKVKIFIFNRSGLTLPRHLKTYLKFKKEEENCILIYEHIGSTSDNAKYPRCELIVKGERELFKREVVCNGIETFLNTINKTYSLNREIKDISFDYKNLGIVSQWIDIYGKTKRLNVIHLGKIVTIITTPIQPLNVVEIKDRHIYSLDRDSIDSFIKDKGVRDSVVRDNELVGYIGNIEIKVNVGNQEIDSVLSSHNRTKKLARYITEYLFWLYSKYIFENDKSINKESMSDFVDEGVIIDPDFEYRDVDKTLSMTSSLMKDGKLVVKSEETLKRLMYVLRLESVRRSFGLINYHIKTELEKYYVDITDFDHYPFQIIFEGDDAIDNWIEHGGKNEYSLNNIVKKGDTPYFFKNDLISDKVYLAQNTDSVYKANTIARVWYRDGYNVGSEPDIEPFLMCKLYFFKSKNKVQLRNITGLNTENDIRIIYNKEFYTVLLGLE